MPEFLATPEGAESVVRSARRRRTAKAGGLGSSTLAVVLGLVVVLTGGTGATVAPDELLTTDGPTSSAGPSPRPSDGSPAEASPTPNPEVTDDPSASPEPDPSYEPDEYPQSMASLYSQTSEPRTSPITRTSGTIEQTDLCDSGVTDLAQTYCIRAYAPPPTVKRGSKVALGGEYCVYPLAKAQTLTFTTTREADFGVTRDTAPTTVWQGGEGITYSKPGATVVVQPGTCLGWTSVWDTRDREGFVVPPGTYSFGFEVEGAGGVGGATITVED